VIVDESAGGGFEITHERFVIAEFQPVMDGGTFSLKVRPGITSDYEAWQ
jgi:hypothetical protein